MTAFRPRSLSETQQPARHARPSPAPSRVGVERQRSGTKARRMAGAASHRADGEAADMNMM